MEEWAASGNREGPEMSARKRRGPIQIARFRRDQNQKKMEMNNMLGQGPASDGREETTLRIANRCRMTKKHGLLGTTRIGSTKGLF